MAAEELVKLGVGVGVGSMSMLQGRFYVSLRVTFVAGIVHMFSDMYWSAVF